MSDKEIKTTAVVLARDEQDTIGSVIKAAAPYVDEVLVVDGHSGDATADRAGEAGARVVKDHGLGKGDGYRTGLKEAVGKVAVFLDADGSHEPADIPELISPILTGERDMVIGTRWRGGSDDVHPNLSHFIRDMGGTFLSMVISYRFKVEITDCLYGYRAVDRKKFLELGLTANDFDVEHEMVMKALKKGLRVAEVPSHEYARAGGVSKLPTAKKAHKFLWRLLKEIW